MSKSSYESSEKTVLEEIIESYKGKRLIPFIGAGFPINIDDFPDWDDFVESLTNNLADKCNVEFKTDENLLNVFGGDNIKATEYYVYKMGKQRRLDAGKKKHSIEEILDEGRNCLRDELLTRFQKFSEIEHDGSSNAEKKWQVYKEFIELNNFSTIYTTNWDHTIEAINKYVFKDEKDKKSYASLLTSTRLRDLLSQGKERLLIKYHGDYDEKDSIIAAESDYFHRLTHRNMLDVKLQHDLLHYDFLFIGFSFEDVFIRLTIHQINDMLRGIDESILPKMFLISIGKPNPFMADYFRLNRLKGFKFCEWYNCEHIKTISGEKTCKKLKKDKKCPLKNYFVEFFKELREAE